MNFNIICPFCQKYIEGVTILRCPICKYSSLFLTYSNYPTDRAWEFLQHEIYISFEMKTTTLFKIDDYGHYLYIMTLPYVADINPSNSQYWFDRLLNLKAFS